MIAPRDQNYGKTMEAFWASYPKWLRDHVEQLYDYRIADATEDAATAQLVAERFIASGTEWACGITVFESNGKVIGLLE